MDQHEPQPPLPAAAAPFPRFDGDTDWTPPGYTELGYEMFLYSMGADLEEADRFDEWVESMKSGDAYAFEAARKGPQRPRIEVSREGGASLRLLNFSSYDYLGLSSHPRVIEAAKSALDTYGLGAASSPVHGGTFGLHKELEAELLDFIGLPGRGVSLFSSGYAVNTGTISACIRRGHYLVLDRSVHMSILEGAQLSRAKVLYFRHNDADDLARVLAGINEPDARVLVCAEGVYSADGDAAPLRRIVDVAKKHGAMTLVDEAHSFLVAGPHGRGVCEAEGVLADVDFLVLTFSKAFGGVGGALVARKEVARYVNWYARCRIFSCAIDPAVTGGILASLRIARSPEGAERRARARANADHLRALLAPLVHIGDTSSWIIPVLFGKDDRAIPLFNFLQREGLEGSIMLFPAVPKNEARIRLFVTAEHSLDDLARCAEIVKKAADRFGFRR